MLPQDDQSPGTVEPGLSNQCRDTGWKERFESLSINAVVEDDRAFKSMLGIGEDAYTSSRLLRIVDDSLVTVMAGVGGGAVASSSVVAGAFFPAGGVMGLLGLGTAVTPFGWVIVGAAAAGLGYQGLRRLTRRMAGPVEVIPRFINSPIDLLAASLFDVMAPLVLKVSHADGECHDAERQEMREYFAGSWGYNREYVDLGLEYAEVNLSGFKTEEVAKDLAKLCKDNRDCNFPAITLNIEGFLQELIAADGRISEEEKNELERVRHAFQEYEKATGVIWKRAAASGSSVRETTDRVAASVRANVPRVAEDLAAAGEASMKKGGKLVRSGASAMAKRLAAASETLSDFAEKQDRSSRNRNRQTNSKRDP